MKKTKAKAKPRTRATTKEKTKAVRSGCGQESSKTGMPMGGEQIKEVDPAEVRRDIANIVGSAARDIAKAVVEKAKLGELATAKYLFEAWGFYPRAAEASTDKPEEETLTRRLIRSLGLPEGGLPSAGDEDAPGVVIESEQSKG